MISLKATLDGITWTADIRIDGYVEIFRGRELFDRGQDDGEIIHGAYKTPKSVLDALLASEPV
mgnify:CR=1 FL=1